MRTSTQALAALYSLAIDVSQGCLPCLPTLDDSFHRVRSHTQSHCVRLRWLSPAKECNSTSPPTFKVGIMRKRACKIAFFILNTFMKHEAYGTAPEPEVGLGGEEVNTGNPEPGR